MDQKELAKWEGLLRTEAERLESGLKSIAKPDPKIKDDWNARFPSPETLAAASSHSSLEEREDMREEYETEMAQEQALEERLGEVSRALERIEDGSYGLCKSCRSPIPAERLEANPAAEYDMEHQPKE